MRDETLEQLSSFVDGELSDREQKRLLDACAHDHGLRDKWARYHLIGTALRAGLPETVPRGLAERVGLALEGEPAILVNRRPRVRTGPALAMAASVAAVTFFSLGGWHPSAPGPSLATGAAPDRATTGARREEIPSAAVLWADEGQDTPARLTAYVLMHNQYDGSLSGPEVSPYFTLVAHDPSP
jgi:sigma-E factor negative regulatory protein RseA